MIDDVPVCFNSVLPFPHPIVKKARRSHRLVVFPDYQGIGIGSRFNDAIATMYVKQGYRFLATLSQPQLINSRKKNPKWRLTSIGRKTNGGKNRKSISSMCNSSNRITTSWEFKK